MTSPRDHYSQRHCALRRKLPYVGIASPGRHYCVSCAVLTDCLSLPVVELEEGQGGQPDVAEAAVPGVGAHAHLDTLVRQGRRQHLDISQIRSQC